MANRIDWQSFDAQIEACYVQDLGRPGLTTRMMVGLLYLKHAFDESDESLLERWIENPYWQYFCGCQYTQHQLPIDSSSFSYWRKRVGVERLEQLLQAMITTPVQMKAVKPSELAVVNVDTTAIKSTSSWPPPSTTCVSCCAGSRFCSRLEKLGWQLSRLRALLDVQNIERITSRQNQTTIAYARLNEKSARKRVFQGRRIKQKTCENKRPTWPDLQSAGLGCRRLVAAG